MGRILTELTITEPLSNLKAKIKKQETPEVILECICDFFGFIEANSGRPKIDEFKTTLDKLFTYAKEEEINIDIPWETYVNILYEGGLILDKNSYSLEEIATP